MGYSQNDTKRETQYRFEKKKKLKKRVSFVARRRELQLKMENSQRRMKVGEKKGRNEEEAISSTMSSMLTRDHRCDFTKKYLSFTPNNGQS
ncbi:hypothetical protein Csa_009980 [Cucumis sativus]|uniref:Uncharacterized protein n=1 Tax=Cucumis sativus TaxID=3659 RepID=A0A0A0L278_CUCSA|nr:hypothetical protein Csa_009980 [Cucumis sativus]